MRVNEKESILAKARELKLAADGAEKFAVEQSDLLIKTHTKFDHVGLQAEKRRLEALHKAARSLRLSYNNFVKKNGL